MSALYDTASDVIIKAMRGANMSPEMACRGSELAPAELIGLIRKEAPSREFLPVADNLGLDADALERLDRPREPVEAPPCLRQIELPFEEECVNIWILEHPEKSLVIDAGFKPADVHKIEDLPESFDLLITHAHRDHIGALAALSHRASRVFAPSSLEGCERITPGQQLDGGPWQIQIFDLGGHHPEAVGYRISGNGLTFAAVGDAIFARSAGGCPDTQAYQSAKTTVINFWRQLDEETFLLTGHGPLTTVTREEKENPFLKGWIQEFEGYHHSDS